MVGDRSSQFKQGKVPFNGIRDKIVVAFKSDGCVTVPRTRCEIPIDDSLSPDS